MTKNKIRWGEKSPRKETDMDKEQKLLEAKRYYLTNKAIYEAILAAMEKMLKEGGPDQDNAMVISKIASSKDWIAHYSEMLEGY